MTKRFLVGVLAAAFLAGCGDAYAQRQGGQDGGGRMSPEERQRLREDMNSTRRDVYKDGGQQRRDPPPQHGGHRMTDAEREQLRRDMMDANRGMPRR